MEEEGDIVYFESSPELQIMKDADMDLTYNVHHTTTASKHSNTDAVVQSWLYNVFKILVNFSLGRSHEQFNNVRTKLIEQIQSSSLLTEEDYQSLIFTLKSDSYSTSTSIRTSPMVHNSPFFLLTVSMLILAILWVWFGVFVSLLITIIIIITVVISKMIISKSESCDNHVIRYLKDCEKFLSLLSLSLQTIQEREMTYHGYDRLEYHTIQYQCIALRTRLYSLCQKGVWLTREHVQSLVTEYPLPLELDNPQCYLSFTELSELHDHLGDETMEAERVGINKPAHLSLQSLKSAASVYAVTNSELLKRVSILLRYSSNPQTTKGLKNVMTSLCQFVCDGGGQLEWSLQYHHQPIHVDAKTTPISHNSSAHFNETPFIDLEVHSSDVHILTALNKLRELKVDRLAEDDPTAALGLKDEISSIINNLYSAERHLLSMVSHLADKRVSHRDNACRDNDNQSSNEDTTESMLLSLDKSDSSTDEEEEERVYEAIVTSTEQSFSHQYSTKEDDELSKSQREASMNVLHELNSVLAARRTEKQKKRRLKQNKQKPLLYDKPESITNDQLITDKKEDYITEIDNTDNSSFETGMTTLPNAVSKTDSHSTSTRLSPLQYDSLTTTNVGIEQYSTTDIRTEIGPSELAGGINLIALAVASKAKIKIEEIIEDSD